MTIYVTIMIIYDFFTIYFVLQGLMLYDTAVGAVF